MIEEPGKQSINFFQWLSFVALALGIGLGAVASIQLLADAVHAYAISQVDYAVIDRMPVIQIPSATPTSTPTVRPTATATPQPTSTPLPTATSTSTATPTPTPLPPVRIRIASIGLNSRVEPLLPQLFQDSGESASWIWPDPGYMVGHFALTGRPTEDRNIVLSGHNNWKGQVFRNLPSLELGDMIQLSTADEDYSYVVVEKVIIPYRRDPVKGEAELWKYLGPQPSERLTLFSCYPFISNADRIVVIAEPAE